MPPPPRLVTIAFVFLRIGLQSWGGGMSAWIRREVVLGRHWMDEPEFLAGLTLCQIAPGPNAINLAVLVGTTLRGAPGALAAVAGLVVPPALLLLALGAGLSALHGLPGLSSAMAGLGASAIGLVFANAFQLARHNLHGGAAFAVALLTAGAIGLLRLPLLPVLAVMIPTSLLLARCARRKA